MKIIYLHIYKDIYLIFMQAYKALQDLLNYYQNLEKISNSLSNIKSIYY